MRIHSWALTTIMLTASVSCSRKIPEPEAVPAQPAALTAEEKPAEPAPAPPEPEKKGPSEDFIGYPKEGWTKLKLNEQTPLCVFANELERFDAKFIEQVKKKPDLKAGKPVTFGAYGPYCINKACDDLPSLQCVVKRDGKDLNVIARYIGYHKDGATCTEDCQQVTAGCNTPDLEAGTYTVHYGEQQYKLKIPSKPAEPCFKR